ncbi:hypothetical protein BD310DRAFT_910145 [Dichomitus squalens]|uniref:Uncharacterized protein n=1 Tax=Dichomitus squalens TaxID=114155 RepID=A0A4Q9PCL7_9APHY|nr:hypothetical protein BD310DRAFT_910145 [Dichomitus squalens]
MSWVLHELSALLACTFHVLHIYIISQCLQHLDRLHKLRIEWVLRVRNRSQRHALRMFTALNHCILALRSHLTYRLKAASVTFRRPRHRIGRPTGLASLLLSPPCHLRRLRPE